MGPDAVRLGSAPIESYPKRDPGQGERKRRGLEAACGLVNWKRRVESREAEEIRITEREACGRRQAATGRSSWLAPPKAEVAATAFRARCTD
jgi:hypothetical protein